MKDRRKILKEIKLKEEKKKKKPVKVRKVEKEDLLREVTMNIGFKKDKYMEKDNIRDTFR